MAFSLIWLPQVLRAAGLTVREEPGWQNRGRGEMGTVMGVICHHTGGGRQGNIPSLNVLINGRAAAPGVSRLQGPLSQLGLARNGTWHVIAAGRCNHAGEGIWQGLTNGNSNFIGIEAENTGGANDFPWPQAQMEAYQRGVAAILKHIRRGPEFCAGHKEWALPKGRKKDPTFDMVAFRAGVAALLNQSVPPPPPPHPGVETRPTLRRGARGPLVALIQNKLRVNAGGALGTFGPATEAAVMAFQRSRGLMDDGIVGPGTWAALDTLP